MGVEEKGQVLVTVGTTLFDALVRVVASQECRELLASLGYSSLVIQLGRGSFKPVEVGLLYAYNSPEFLWNRRILYLRFMGCSGSRLWVHFPQSVLA